MTMRLNLGTILKNQVRSSLSESDNTDAPLTGARENAKLRIGYDSSLRYFPDKADVKNRVNSMMANIHKHMKTTTPPRKAVPAIPGPIAQISSPPSLTKSTSSKKIRRIRGGGVGGLASGKTPVLPISQIKARMNRQSQQVMRRGYSEIGPKSFSNQRRIREVMLQKTVLENMLLQHKRLQRDRQTIASDIQRMRQDLDRIKNKLDTSLQTLNSTRTLYTGLGKGKKGSAIVALSSHVIKDASGSTRSAGGKARSAAAKLGNVTMKRQHAAAAKRRSRL
ncbi:uncharacterized protein LOC135427646 [Drosophila montana]|uniref:uncharacterized protein LOC135427646 n=1 Tax=Drosophila montana TaxID=40370 RepID=UPI00313D6F03